MYLFEKMTQLVFPCVFAVLVLLFPCKCGSYFTGFKHGIIQISCKSVFDGICLSVWQVVACVWVSGVALFSTFDSSGSPASNGIGIAPLSLYLFGPVLHHVVLASKTELLQ